ncbi:zinc finger protein RFP-like [Rhineura floridana]|uniref:zinc finger protein RFP-like n=1 Tax=Rhineura floridana TaxID=261503 RepID=UPI002AC86B53|nr:zinc finger protein RFP-like [Rhineura floridana]
MAAPEDPVKSLQEEATCSICLDYFQEPVTLDCGHNFCQACIARRCETSETGMACPQCREPAPQRSFRLNKQLAGLVELVKQLKFDHQAGTRASMCERHKEALKLFCEEDQAAICLVCHLSREHRGHACFPLEEATQEYLEKIQTCLGLLKKEKAELEKLQADELTKSQKYMKQIEVEKQTAVSAFQCLRHFLEKQERLLLEQLEQLKEESVRMRGETLTKLSHEVTHLSTLIAEVEKKCRQSAGEFLQDIRSTLSRCEKREFQKPEHIYPKLEERLKTLSIKRTALTKSLKKCKGMLSSDLKNDACQKDAYQKVNVTLDLETANPFLALSADFKNVQLRAVDQLLPVTPKRFLCDPCVLGKEGFSSGKITFVVEVGATNGWAVGVASESVKRNERITFKPEERVWALYFARREYHALTSPSTKLHLAWNPRKIGVFLDYEGGEVVFRDDAKNAVIYRFKASFTEKMFPFCWVPGRSAHLSFS